MKKPILIALLAFLSLSVKAQKIIPPIDSITHKITYQGVEKVAGNKDELYDKGLNWVALSFKSANDVIQIKDKENGKIVGKFNIEPIGGKVGFVSATITLLFKEGRYKYVITDFYYNGNGLSGMYGMQPWALEDDPGAWKVNMTKGSQHKLKDSIYTQIMALVEDLKKYMSANNSIANF